MDNRQWREFMDAAMGVPPGRVTVAAVRRRLVRRRIREAAGVLAAVVVAVIGVTAAVRVFGAAPGPAAPHRSTAPTVYVAYATERRDAPPREPRRRSAVIPISTATNTAGKPIKVGPAAIQSSRSRRTGRPPTSPTPTRHGHPDQHRHQHGREADPRRPQPYFGPSSSRSPRTGRPPTSPTGSRTRSPRSAPPPTRAGKPIHVGRRPGRIAITPDGKTAYVVNEPHERSTVTPISTATNTAGKPIHVGRSPVRIAITPDGKTAYVVISARSRSPRSARPPTRPASRSRSASRPACIAITPDGKTAYVVQRRLGHGHPDQHRHQHGREADPRRPTSRMGSRSRRTGRPPTSERRLARSPRSAPPPTRPGTPIPVGHNPDGIAITPDGKTAYVGTSSGTVTPINTATNTAGKPIKVAATPSLAIAITPSPALGKTTSQ